MNHERRLHDAVMLHTAPPYVPYQAPPIRPYRDIERDLPPKVAAKYCPICSTPFNAFQMLAQSFVDHSLSFEVRRCFIVETDPFFAERGVFFVRVDELSLALVEALPVATIKSIIDHVNNTRPANIGFAYTMKDTPWCWDHEDCREEKTRQMAAACWADRYLRKPIRADHVEERKA